MMRVFIHGLIVLLLTGCTLSARTQVPTSAPAPLPTTLADAHQELAARARAALVTQSTVDEKTLQLQRIQSETWPTSALGCPASGQLYTQVLTPGYLIIFGDTTRTYDIHAASESDPLIWCDGGIPKSVSSSETR